MSWWWYEIEVVNKGQSLLCLCLSYVRVSIVDHEKTIDSRAGVQSRRSTHMVAVNSDFSHKK